jgi:rieske iron-sulfur protein
MILGGCLTVAATGSCGLVHAVHAEGDADPARDMRPQVGDLLVFSSGDHEGAVIKIADLKVGAPPVFAWPFDSSKKLPRDGSHFNQIVMIRFEPTALSPSETSRAVDGVVAYSATCTHQACAVTDWMVQKKVLQCPCHQSEYDLADGAKVVTGPAPRPLPALPLKVADGALVVAAPFTDRVGGQKL